MGDRMEKVAEQEAGQELLSTSADESPWALRPSVGTWLMPLHANQEAEVQEAPGSCDCSSVPVAAEPKPGKVRNVRFMKEQVGDSHYYDMLKVSEKKVQTKTLGARVMTWFGCAQALAAEPS